MNIRTGIQMAFFCTAGEFFWLSLIMKQQEEVRHVKYQRINILQRAF